MHKIFFLLCSALYLHASSAFIASEYLESRLKHPNLVLLDVTDSETYEAGHIPGAVRVDVSDFRDKIAGYQLMKHPKEVESTARSLGINNDSHIIIYGHGKKKELLKSSYIALSLIVNGAKNVSLLDGGYSDWMFETSLSSTKEPNIKHGNFKAKHNPDVLVDLNYVAHRINKVAMIDSRPLRFYTGEAGSKGVKRRGHIPGALSSFWKDKFRQDDTILDMRALKDIYIANHKLDPKEELIVYCTGGLETSMNWYITKQHMGFKNVKVYDASLREWGNRFDTPLEQD